MGYHILKSVFGHMIFNMNLHRKMESDTIVPVAPPPHVTMWDLVMYPPGQRNTLRTSLTTVKI